MSVQSADGIQRARVTVYLHCSSILFFGGGQSQRTLSPLFVEDFEERVEVPAAASALHGVAFAFGMLF